MENAITIRALINAPVNVVWNKYTKPEHIIKWNAASSDWHTTKAENDLRVGGKFCYRMESKDGKNGFDFNGTYTSVKQNKVIEYIIEGGREVKVNFKEDPGKTSIVITFQAENENSLEMQKAGWQSILNNFKKYVESNSQLKN